MAFMEVAAFANTSKKDRTKVLLVAPLPPPMGGMSTHVQGLLQSKVSAMFDLRVVRSDFLQKYRYLGVWRQVVNILNGMVLMLAVFQAILLWRPAVVHIQTNSGYGFFEKSVLALLARLCTCKVLMHIHGGGFRSFYNRSSRAGKWFIRRCAALNNRIIVATPQMRETCQMIGVPEEKIVLIRNAITLPVKSIWENIDSGPCLGDGVSGSVTVLFLNRIDLAKGVLELIDAAKQLSDALPKLRVRIVGARTHENLLVKEYIHTSSVGSHVQFVGQVSEKEKEAEFMNADIYVLPSHVEDLPYGLLEAMSYGVPCVSSNVGGISSLIENGINGMLIPPKDVDALAHALEQMTRDPGLRRRLGSAARRTIEEEFSWDCQAEEMGDLYREMLLEVPGKTS